jgi:hypothetical protein
MFSSEYSLPDKRPTHSIHHPLPNNNPQSPHTVLFHNSHLVQYWLRFRTQSDKIQPPHKHLHRNILWNTDIVYNHIDAISEHQSLNNQPNFQQPYSLVPTFH